MRAQKHLVTIKGVKEGLIFLLDDRSPLKDVLKELQHKLEITHQQILKGPHIHVQIKLGTRQLSEKEKEQIREIIQSRGNLMIQSIEADPVIDLSSRVDKDGIKVLKGIIRSGQTWQHEGRIMLLGDVNPGGSILSTGDIYIMGSLRGLAHAGSEGNDQAIIAASHMRPTQLRIAHVISRSPDEWGIDEAFMEFAYIRDGVMEIDKIHQLQHIRPELE